MARSYAGILLRRKQSPGAAPTMFGEAFCLMKYRNRATGRVEWLWNSRDGVTPFGVDDPACTEELAQAWKEERLKNIADPKWLEDHPDPMPMAHVDWHEDLFAPNFVPPVGMRVFMNWSDVPDPGREKVTARYHAYLDQILAEHPDVPEPPGIREKSPFGMKDVDPCVVVVDADLAEHFHMLARENPMLPGAPATPRPEAKPNPGGPRTV